MKVRVLQNKYIRGTHCSVRGSPELVEGSNHGQPALRQAQGEWEGVFDKLHLQVV